MGCHLTAFTSASEELVFSAILYDIFRVLFFFSPNRSLYPGFHNPRVTLFLPIKWLSALIKELWLGAADNTVIIFFTIYEQQHCLGQETLQARQVGKNKKAEVFRADSAHHLVTAVAVRICHAAHKAALQPGYLMSI